MVSSMGIALQNGGHRGSGILRRGASHLVGMAGHALVNKLASLIGGSYKLTGLGTRRRRTHTVRPHVAHRRVVHRPHTVHRRVVHRRAPRLSVGTGRKRRVGRPRGSTTRRIGVRKPRMTLGTRRRRNI